MNISIRTRLIAVAVMSAAWIGIPAAAQTSVSSNYTFKQIDVAGAAATYPLGINSHGAIAGFSVDQHFIAHGFLYRSGSFTTIDHPKAAQAPGAGTVAGGINDRGDIVGTYTAADGHQHGFIRTMPEDCQDAEERDGECKATFTDIDVPGATYTTGIVFELGTGLGTAAIGINNHRQITGMYATSGMYSNGFLRTNGKYEAIDSPGADHLPGAGTKIFSITNEGAMAGDYLKHNPNPMAPPGSYLTYGFLLDHGRYTSILVPGSDVFFGTQVNGINDRNMVVGTFTDGMGSLHSLLWIAGQYFTVDFPGKPFNEAHSINNQGQITGAFIDDPFGRGTPHGYLATPKDR